MKGEVLWCGKFFSSTIKSCLFAYLQCTRSPQHPGMLLKPNWTCMGGEGTVIRIRRWWTFDLPPQHPSYSLKPCVLQLLHQESPSSLWEACISLSAHLIILRMHKTSFQAAINMPTISVESWKPSLERWVTESKSCPVPLRGVMAYQVKWELSIF